MSNRTIDEIKKVLKPGWEGRLYLEKKGTLLRGGYEEIQGKVLEPYVKGKEDKEDGIVIQKDRGGTVKVPYNMIKNFEPAKTLEEVRKQLKIGFIGDLYLKKGKVNGKVKVTGIYNNEIVIDQPKMGKKGKLEHRFRIIPITDVVDVHIKEITNLSENEKGDSNQFYQNKKR